MKKKTEDKKETQETNKKKAEDELAKRKELQELLKPEKIKKILELMQPEVIDGLLKAVKTGKLEQMYPKNYQEYNYATFCKIILDNSENGKGTIPRFFLDPFKDGSNNSAEKDHRGSNASNDSNYKNGSRDIPGCLKTPIINLENKDSIDMKNEFIDNIKECITDKNIQIDSQVFLLRYSMVQKICIKLYKAIQMSEIREEKDGTDIQEQFEKLGNLIEKKAPVEKIKNQMARFLADAYILAVKNNHKKDEMTTKPKKPLSKNLDENVESEYLQELLEMWSQAKGIKIQDKEELEKNTTLKRQYHNYIRNFCTADSIRRGLSATKKEPIFDDLKREIYDCIIDVYDQEYRNNVERMLTVLHEASRAPLSPKIEEETYGWIGPGEKKGICHILAHEKYISWKGDEELNEFFNE